MVITGAVHNKAGHQAGKNEFKHEGLVIVSDGNRKQFRRTVSLISDGNDRDDRGWTLLHVGARKGDYKENTLVEYMILSGADNHPPMLDKDLYDSWKSRMELYMQNKEHKRMILESIEHGPLIWPTVKENSVIRTKKYAELSAAENIQADCDMKATNIILQGRPADIYSLVNHHKVVKDL
ncbi:copia protein [Tanacetum coccineum]